MSTDGPEHPVGQNCADHTTGQFWIGRGTWLIDNAPTRSRIGVVREVQERDRGMAARIGIQWRPNSYENASLLIALEKFKSGRWEVDR